MYGELYLPPESDHVNKKNGQFMKGHIPHNKGKKWSEWLDGRKQKKIIRIAMKNLKCNPNIGGWNKRQVIGIDKNDHWSVFESGDDAGRKFNINSRNIRRCCQTQKGNNTYYGIRFFWADDPKLNNILKDLKQ